MANMKTSIVQMVLVLVLIGMAAWLFSNLGALGDDVSCIVDRISDLQAIPTTTQAGIRAGDAANAVPSNVLNPIKQAVPFIAILAIVPAAFLAFFSCLISFCVMKTKANEGAGCTKCLMVLFTFNCFSGIVFYLMIGGIGIAATSGPGNNAKDELTQTCNQYGPEFLTAIPPLKVALNIMANITTPPMGPGDAPYDAAANELSVAESASRTFVTLCGCMTSVFDSINDFTAPGLACCAVCFLLFLVNCMQCCQLCCRKTKTAPAA